MFVMVRGNPGDGFQIIGPFSDAEQAIAYMESETDGDPKWIMPLTKPDPWFMAEYRKET